jgi:peptide/nickel transport system permease protein
MERIKIIVAKRLAMGLVTLIAISALIFISLEALPGDTATAILGQQATPEAVAALRKELKLDLPPHIRYIRWLSSFVHGDLGTSLASKRPIAEVIGWRFSNTIFLAASVAVIAFPLALILGMLAALYRDKWFDRLVSISTLSTISFPEFFISYILIALFAVKLEIFPSFSSIDDMMSFWEKIHSIMLPCLTLTLIGLAHTMRMTRAAIINVLASPYIEMAQLKGIKLPRIIVYHAFPNVIAPVLNVIAMALAWLVAGVVIVEVVFAYPGLGKLLVDSVANRDLPVVQSSGLIFACTYVLLNLTADILAMISNPRIRHPN